MEYREFIAGVVDHTAVDRQSISWWLQGFAPPPMRPDDVCTRLAAGVPGEHLKTLFNLTNCPRSASLRIEGSDNLGWIFTTERVFDMDQKVLHQGFLEIDLRMQGFGYGTKFARNCYLLAQAIGISEIKIRAIDGGAYAWARSGFIPEAGEWDNCLGKVENKLRGLLLPSSVRNRVQRLLQSSRLTAIWRISDIGYQVASTLYPSRRVTLGRVLLAESKISWSGSINFLPHEDFDGQHNRARDYFNL